MMDEERFGFLSPTGDGNAVFADIPSEAVSSYFRYGLVTLSDNDDRLGGGGKYQQKATGARGR